MTNLSLRPPGGGRAKWRSTSAGDVWALLALFCLFGFFTWRSWLAWGHVSSDYGRSMYIPLRLLDGDVLYRDVRYPYGPLSPYLHAVGYWLWGPHLGVLYASGLVSTATALILLFSVARSLASLPAATLGVALVLVDLTFKTSHPGFSYVFPYAFPAVHGVVLVLGALAAAVSLIRGAGYMAALGCGVCVGLALLSKHEFGAVAFAIGVLACLGAWALDGRNATGRMLLLVATSCAVAVAGWVWLLAHMSAEGLYGSAVYDADYFGWPLTWSIAGLEPGMSAKQVVLVTARVIGTGAITYILAVGVIVGSAFAWRGRLSARVLGLAGMALGLWYLVPPLMRAFDSESTQGLEPRYACLPLLLLVWLVAEAGRGWVVWRRRGSIDSLIASRFIVVAASLAVLGRVIPNVVPDGYQNFYLPTGVVLVVYLMVDLVPAWAASIGGDRRAGRMAAISLWGALFVVIFVARYVSWAPYTESISTPRGTMVLRGDDAWLHAFRDAIRLVQAETRAGDTVFAAPTETALYFLAERGTPLYETSIITTVLTPEEEQGVIADLEHSRPRLVLLSNRVLWEYARGRFGVDFGRQIFSWVKQNYEKSGEPLGSGGYRIQVWKEKGAT